jgi:anti-sigma B factor antagonist
MIQGRTAWTVPVAASSNASQSWEESMYVEKRHRDDVCVLDLVGTCLQQESGDGLRDAVQSLLHDGTTKLVLNLGRVTHVDSAGLGRIVQCRALVERGGGTLKIASLTQGVRDLLSITKLVTVFETYDHEEDALTSFASPALAGPASARRES